MPVHASPPIVWTYRCLPNVKLGPRFGYGLEINQSIGPSCRDPDVRLHKADMLGDGHASVERATATGTGDGRHRSGGSLEAITGTYSAPPAQGYRTPAPTLNDRLDVLVFAG